MSHSCLGSREFRNAPPPPEAETMLSSPRLLQPEPRCSSDSKLWGYKVWRWDFSHAVSETLLAGH